MLVLCKLRPMQGRRLSSDEIVKLLINSGPGRLDGNALQATSASGHIDVVRFLSASGAVVNVPVGEKGPALQAVAMQANPEVVHALIDAGALNGGPEGATATLCLAACHGLSQNVALLLYAGANIHIERPLRCRLSGPIELSSRSPHYYDVSLVGQKVSDGNGMVFLLAFYRETEHQQMIYDKDPLDYLQLGVLENDIEIARKLGHKEIETMLLDIKLETNSRSKKHPPSQEAACKRAIWW